MIRIIAGWGWSRLLFAILVADPAVAGQAYYDAVAAIVGEEVITRSDIVNEAREIEERLARKYKGRELAEKTEEERKRIGERMIEQELVYAEFKSKGYKLPAEAVQRRMDSIITAQAGGNRERFAEMLYNQGLSFSEFESKVAKLVAVDLLLDEMVRRPIRVSPTDVRQYFDTHQDDYTQPARVKMAVILIRKDGRYQGQLEKTVQELAEILRREPAEFAHVARRFSEGPSADAGGELGWVAVKDMSQEFRDALASLGPGQVSKPVAISEGMAILKLIERERQALPEFDDLIAKRIENRLKDREEERRYKAYIKTLTAKHFVQNFWDGATE